MDRYKMNRRVNTLVFQSNNNYIPIGFQLLVEQNRVQMAGGIIVFLYCRYGDFLVISSTFSKNRSYQSATWFRKRLIRPSFLI